VTLVEIVAAVLLGAALLWLVLGPLVRGTWPREQILEPEEAAETPRGIALAALREVEFDRETGKLSDDDYHTLKSQYTGEALAALRAAAGPDIEAMVAARVRGVAFAPACPTCGPRVEPDAIFCSSCGRRLGAIDRCEHCRSALVPGGLFCESCGARVAA